MPSFALTGFSPVFSLNPVYSGFYYFHAHARSIMSDSLRPRGLQPARLLCPRDSPGKNTGVGCHFLLQGIFRTRGSNPGLLRWEAGSLPLGRQGSLAASLTYKAAVSQNLVPGHARTRNTDFTSVSPSGSFDVLLSGISLSSVCFVAALEIIVSFAAPRVVSALLPFCSPGLSKVHWDQTS